MMQKKSITFITGNAEKIRDAKYASKQYDIILENQDLHFDEIQHHDPEKITEHKAKTAYSLVNHPVVVNDHHWAILSLGGFPGGYMKDVQQWLSVGDFLNLINDKQDKSVVLTEVIGFYDGTNYKSFMFKRKGNFIDSPRGNSKPDFTKIVVFENDTMTIAELFDQPERPEDPLRYKNWQDFFEWYLAGSH